MVGVVETHGRKDTAAMLEGLAVLPPKRQAYRGRHISEFDLDAALARRPALILMDELAHSNAPGSRHPKRWQDIEELLEAGIDVFTTVNVQHLESLNDVVSGVTGIQVRETVPDPFFDAADWRFNGRTASPSSMAAVSFRPWVSTTPTTISSPKRVISALNSSRN